jgi:hypothetical protein
MVIALLGRVVSSILAAVLAIGLLGGCNEDRYIFGGCTDRDLQLMNTLAGLPILKAHPVSAEMTMRESGCDTDDDPRRLLGPFYRHDQLDGPLHPRPVGFAFASNRYLTELDRQAVIAFYRKAAADDGWLPDEENPAPPTDRLVVAAGACFLKQVDGTTAHLQVWFPGELTIPGQPGSTTLGDYAVDITDSHDGAAWC